MQTVDRAELWADTAAGEQPPLLVHGGGPTAFREAHIPGSIAFADVAEAVGVLRRHDVVVYGADADDADAARVVRYLAGLGLPRVRWYAGGLADWRTAGLPVEGVRATGD